MDKHLAILTNLTGTTPAVQVSSTLRTFGAAVDGWWNEYLILRAKMLAKGVGETDEQAVVQQYRGMRQRSTNMFAEAARILRGRTDVASFEPDLQRADGVLNKLPP